MPNRNQSKLAVSFFSCICQGFTLFPRATMKSIAAATNNWKIAFINSKKRMFELSSTAEKLGCACVGTMPNFAYVGSVCKCNINIRLTGLLSLVGDAQQDVCEKKPIPVQLCHFPNTVYLESHLSQYNCRCVLGFSQSKDTCSMMSLKPELYWLHPLSDFSITAWLLYRKTQDSMYKKEKK